MIASSWPGLATLAALLSGHWWLEHPSAVTLPPSTHSFTLPRNSFKLPFAGSTQFLNRTPLFAPEGSGADHLGRSAEQPGALLDQGRKKAKFSSTSRKPTHGEAEALGFHGWDTWEGLSDSA